MAVKLSKRLNALASMLPEHYPRLLDVGCDHAQLSINQLLGKRCQRVLAIDIEEGPLARAKRAVDRSLLEKQVDCILNDGLKKIDLFPGDVLVLAGMGGLEICDILENCELESYLSKGLSGKNLRLVLQPLKSQPLLRVFMAFQGFKLLDEKVVREKNKVYTMASYAFPDQVPERGLKDRLLKTSDDDLLFAIHKKAKINPSEALLGRKISEAYKSQSMEHLNSDELYYCRTELERLFKLRHTNALINGLGHVSRLFKEAYF